MSIFTLFTNPTALTRSSSLYIVSSRLAIKNRKSIRDISDPYRIPVFIRIYLDSSLTSLILVYLLSRKLVTYRTSVSGIRLFRRLYSSLLCETLLNAPDISRLRRVATCCGPGRFQISCTCSVRSCSADSAERPSLAPICVRGSSS